MNIAVIAITKNGIKISKRIKEILPDCEVFAPVKLSDNSTNITWYTESTTEKIPSLFNSKDALICIFSLGAVIRLVAPHLKSKKTDPAVLVIDDKVNFVISALSGHIGGANELTQKIASELNSTPVITTAADVNNTISVDLVGRKLGWKIDDDSNVTKISAHMVNEEKIGVFQDTGRTDWYEKLPKNVQLFDKLEDMKNSDAKAFLIITDKMLDNFVDSIVYRPPSLVVGVGLHWDTPKETIMNGIDATMKKFGLSTKSIFKLASIKKDQDPKGLEEVSKEMNVKVEYVDREELSEITAPNPSDTVMAFEGTASVSEAAAIKVSSGRIIVEKQKFPPNLTIAVARRIK